MPHPGGPSNISGVEYELWFVTLKYSEAFLNPDIEVTAQAGYLNTGIKGQDEHITSVDDVVISENGRITHFTIKQNAPEQGWTAASLISNGVINEIKDQFLKTPENRIVLISQSDSKLIREYFRRVESCRNRKDLERELGSKIKDWDKLIDHTKLSESSLIKMCSNCHIIVYPLEDIKGIVKDRFLKRVNQPDQASQLLFFYALERAKWRLRTSQTDIIKYLRQKEIYEISSTDLASISSDLVRYSASLNDNPTEFTGLQNSKIDREETEQILEWIQNPLEIKNGKLEDPVLTLAGNAGTGKTTILKHLYDRLNSLSIPVLGIKADRVNYESYESFRVDLNLSENLDQVLATIATKSGKVVLLVDQIDALSLSLSKNRSPIHNYTNFITKAAQIKNARIVVSCRVFDLNNDPRLKMFNSKKVIEVKPLPVESVEQILKRIQNLQIGVVSEKLKELLSIPLHLDVFTRLDLEKVQVNELTTLESLYSRLWDQKLLFSPSHDYERLRLFLSNCAYDMFQNQVIHAYISSYEAYQEEYKFLFSEGLIVRAGENGRLAFFHQTFFDYTLARSFVAEGKSISKDIKEAHQGLFIRNKMRAVISYLRSTKSRQYLEEINEIALSSAFRFHIKVLLIKDICSTLNPSKKEKDLIRTLLNQPDFTHVVFESLNSIWFKALSLDVKTLLITSSSEHFNSVRWLCARTVEDDEEVVIDFLKNLPDFNEKEKFICEVLFHFKAFETNGFKLVFNSARDYLRNYDNSFLYYHILEHASVKWPDWVLDELFEDLKKRFNSIDKLELYRSYREIIEHDAYDVYKKVFSNTPQKAYHFYKKCLNFLVSSTETDYFSRHKVQDQAFIGFERESDHHYRTNYHFIIPVLIKEFLVSNIETDTEFVLEELKELSLSKYSTMGYLFFWIALESPHLTKDLALDFLFGWLDKEETRGEGRFDKLFFEYLSQHYENFDEQQRQTFARIVLAIKDPIRAYGEEPKLNKYYGESQISLLSRIPDGALKKDRRLYGLKKELERKWDIIRKERTPFSRFEKPRVPNLPDSAIQNMPFLHWQNFISKYPETTKVDEYPLYYDNARKLKELIKPENLEHFEKLGRKFISDESIPLVLCSNLLEALSKGGSDINLILELYEQLIQRATKNKYEIRNLMEPVENLIGADKYSSKVFKWLIKCFKTGDMESSIGEIHGENEDDDEQLFAKGFNTTRGMAIFKLLRFANDEQDFTEIVQLIDDTKDELTDEVICVLVNRLALLNKFDKERCVDLYWQLCKNRSKQVLYSADWSAQYMAHANFSKLHDFFSEVINRVTNDSRMDYYGKLLTVAAYFNYPKAKELLEEAFKKNNKFKAGSIDMVVEYVASEENTPYMDELWHRFLEERGKDFVFGYSRFFRECKPESFERLYDFIEAFTRSRVGLGRDKEYYDFLLKCSPDYPEKCIDLVLSSPHPKPDIRHSILDDEPLQVVINSYNSIDILDMDNEYAEKAMDAFDLLLKDSSYRNPRGNFFHDLDGY